MYIYGLCDPITCEVRYVGATKNLKKRMASHLDTPVKTHKGCWIASLLKKGLQPAMYVIEEVSNTEWQDAERRWIAQYKALGANLTNATDGGDGVVNLPQEAKDKIRAGSLGKIRSPETRLRLSESHKGQRPWNYGKSSWKKGKTVSEETRSKIRAAMIGKKHPPERVEKNSMAHMGQPAWNKGQSFSDETKQKMSAARMGKEPWNKGRKANGVDA